MTGTIIARWSYMPAGTEPDGRHREAELATPDDVHDLIEQLGDPDATEAHLVHNARPHEVDEWSGDETVDHQVTVGVHDGFGYMGFIDAAHVVQILGEPESPGWHTYASEYFNPGSGVPVTVLIAAVAEFLATADLPAGLSWRRWI